MHIHQQNPAVIGQQSEPRIRTNTDTILYERSTGNTDISLYEPDGGQCYRNHAYIYRERRDRYMYVCSELILCVEKLNLGLIVDIIISSIVDLDVELYGSLAYLLLSECSLIST